jgi:hypothetical protein
MEPFLIALYGSPDILHLLNNKYSGGSLRCMLSRYIGIATYNSSKMTCGKMLNDFVYKNTNHYFNSLHTNSPYNPPETIGYDFNFHKFKKHGIELRIFDYFPEEYLEDIINFIILLCCFSLYKEIPEPFQNSLWTEFTINCIKNGSNTTVPYELYLRLKLLFDIDNGCIPWCKSRQPRNILYVITKIANHLYKNYKDFSVCQKMSPNMKNIVFIDYNKIIKNNHQKQLNLF